MDSIKSRNLTAHTYDEVTSEQLAIDIQSKYAQAFSQLRAAMLEEKLKRTNQD